MNKLGKFKYVVYSVLALALLALPALAQPGGGAAAAGDNAFTVNAAKAIGARHRIWYRGRFRRYRTGPGRQGATEGVARNPGAVGTVQTIMIIALALIESLVLFALLIAFRRRRPRLDKVF
jgi:F-type H+-transporting ATPase subunit c